MGAATQLNLLWPVPPVSGGAGDSKSVAKTASSAATQRAMPEEFDGERDLGALDLPEDYEEYHDRGFYHPYD